MYVLFRERVFVIGRLPKLLPQKHGEAKDSVTDTQVGEKKI